MKPALGLLCEHQQPMTEVVVYATSDTAVVLQTHLITTHHHADYTWTSNLDKMASGSAEEEEEGKTEHLVVIRDGGESWRNAVLLNLQTQ